MNFSLSKNTLLNVKAISWKAKGRLLLQSSGYSTS